MKKNILFLFFSFILFPFLCINAQERDLIEQNFPNLKRVQTKDDIISKSRIVLIAYENDNFYVVKDCIQKAKHTLIPVTQLSSQNKSIDWDQHSFLIYKDKFLIGCHTKMRYQYDKSYSKSTYLNVVPESPSSSIRLEDRLILENCESGNGVNLHTQFGNRYFTLNSDLNKSGMYSTKSHLIFVYLYNENNIPECLGNISIKTQEGYGTIYTDESYTMPEGLTGFTVTGANNESQDLTLNPCYKGGDPVPAHTALLVKGVKGDYPYYAASTATKNSRGLTASDNLLRGSATECETTAPDNSNNYYFYKLYYLLDAETNSKRLGFFWGSENGAPFMNAANKAYLALPKQESPNIRGFVLPDEHTTDIKHITTDTNSKQNGIYNMSGIKINQTSTTGLPTGWYIIKGKKTWVK